MQRTGRRSVLVPRAKLPQKGVPCWTKPRRAGTTATSSSLSTRRFGESVEGFRQACRRLGWHEEELGDASFRFDILPKIRGLVVLHAGDEEFPAEVNILFDDEIVNFLPLEDVAVLAGLIATRLAKSTN